MKPIGKCGMIKDDIFVTRKIRKGLLVGMVALWLAPWRVLLKDRKDE